MMKVNGRLPRPLAASVPPLSRPVQGVSRPCWCLDRHLVRFRARYLVTSAPDHSTGAPVTRISDAAPPGLGTAARTRAADRSQRKRLARTGTPNMIKVKRTGAPALLVPLIDILLCSERATWSRRRSTSTRAGSAPAGSRDRAAGSRTGSGCPGRSSPTELPGLLATRIPAGPLQAMLQMKKLDIAEIRRA